MRKFVLSSLLIFAAFHFAITQVVTLGSYPTTTITASSNVNITPSGAPSNATSITAYTSTHFKGTLRVNPVTGVVSITNARPAGNYPVTVKAFNGTEVQTTNFLLTIGNANCSQAGFIATASLGYSGNNVKRLLVGDFNNDGKQDFATTDYDSVAVSLGNGAGGFTKLNASNATGSPERIAIGDFNGDGKQDLVVAIFGTSNMPVLTGNGNGTFSVLRLITVGLTPTSIVSGDFNGDGKQDLATAHRFDNRVYIRLGDGTGNFTGNTDMPVGTSPNDLVVGDFNGDGKQDLATVNKGSSNVSILVGNGLGTFSSATPVPVNGTPVAIALDDFNGDGVTDFVTANSSNNTLSVRFGNGAGGFSGTTELSAGTDVVSVTTGDFNGDGRQDIAATNQSSRSVSLWLGNSTGSFTAAPAISGFDFSFALQMTAVGDFNADGREDLAISGGSANTVAIRLGGANEIDVSGNNMSIADGDTTPDVSDKTDFGTAYSNFRQTYTIRNTGNVPLVINNISTGGTDSALFIRSGISLPLTIAAGSSITFSITFRPTTAGVRTTTVNISSNDCDETIYNFSVRGTALSPPVLGTYPTTIISNAGGNTVVTPSVPPTFSAPLSAFTSPNFRSSLQVDTLTGAVTITNAYPAGTYTINVGVVASATSFTLIVNDPSCSQGTFSGTNTFSVGTGPRAIALGDFNKDGNQDLAIPNSNSNNVSIKSGDGAGGFIGTTNLAVNRPFSIAVADFNSDGNQDLVTANFDSSSVTISFGDGAGNFNETSKVSVAAFPVSVISADFNSDGKPDLAVSNGSTNGLVSILLNNGLGGFYGLTPIPVGPTPIFIITGDFNGDGKPDLATANNSTNTVSILIGNGLGEFIVASNVIAGTNPVSLAIADFNGDGKLDLAISNQASANVSIRLGDGAGGFSGTTNIPFALSGSNLPLAIATGDFNGDGNQDFLLTINGSNMIAVRLGNGAGGFSTAPNIIVESNPRSVLVGDFNNDGKQDIAAANAGSNTVSIRLGANNDISVTGNNIAIADNDTTPDVNDYTDFSSTPTGAIHSRTFTIQNTSLVNLTINNILSSGPDSSLFTVSGITLPYIVTAGASKTFTITFSPLTAGIKTATVNIINDNCDKATYDFAITGASCPASDPSNTWLGITADWNLPNNWSLNFVPSECTKVVVNNGVPFMPEITSSTSACYSLTLNNGATVTVKIGGHLNITANN